MGYLDRQLTGSSGQSVAGAAGTPIISTDVIDLANSGRDLGRMNEMRALALVGSAVTSGGAATLTVELIESPNPDLSGATSLFSTGAVALAGLGASTVLVDIAVPRTSQRYLGWRYTPGTAATTGGTITSTITKNTNTPVANRPTGNTGVL